MDERPESHSLFAACAPGLEEIVAGEMSSLGLLDVRAEPGGVAMRGTLRDAGRANLHSRCATRILLRIAEFRATSFHELERGAKRVPWSAFVRGGSQSRLRVTCRKSRLYHSDAVAERISGALERVTGVGSSRAAAGKTEDDDAEDSSPAQLFVVRVDRDRVTISVDSSGELLHRRGYRLAVAKAPIRETLAAAMLIASGWKEGEPLIDPFCGSGTIIIEAAMRSMNIAPGLLRARKSSFAFVNWPHFESSGWLEDVEEAERLVRVPGNVTLAGFDRDAGAIQAAESNAARAGVDSLTTFRVQPMGAIAPVDTSGWIVTNPPYGVRVGEAERLRDLYDAMGSLLRSRLGEWNLAILATGPELVQRLGLRLRVTLSTQNGGIPVQLMVHRAGG
jgi:putative N6-adenine-specific DNA methylase